MTERVFLDTTIQCEKVLGDEGRTREIRARLNRHYVMTSSYVRMEYNRTVVDDFITLHTVAQSSERLGDIMIRLSAGSYRFRPHAVWRRVMILGQLLNQCVSQNEEQLRDELITRLEMYIESGLHVEFRDGVDEVLNSTDCDLPKDHPHLIDDAFGLQVTCRREKAQCQLPALIEAHRAQIGRVSEHLRNHPDEELRRLAQVAAQVLQTPGKAQGQKNCWRLGDLIIALEAPPDAAIYTTNMRHFAPLCDILGKRLLPNESVQSAPRIR